MNALAHGMEALYTPLANPVAERAALRGAEAIFAEDVALGAFLCGWASGMTGFAVHHATCQLIVRTAGSPHAQTNAVMLPHFAGLMSGRVPGVDGRARAGAGRPGRRTPRRPRDAPRSCRPAPATRAWRRSAWRRSTCRAWPRR